jgi:hypothetical protein
MLPYTTYNIPENPELLPSISDKWLWLITDKTLTNQTTSLLKKISDALKADFDTATYCLILEAGQSIALADYKNARPGLIISFGVEPSALGLWIDLSKPGYIALEQFSFILTTDPDRLAESTPAKKALWRSMQEFMEKQ